MEDVLVICIFETYLLQPFELRVVFDEVWGCYHCSHGTVLLCTHIVCQCEDRECTLFKDKILQVVSIIRLNIIIRFSVIRLILFLCKL